MAWVKVTPAGVERLGIGLPAGLTPDDVAAKTDAIAHAFRAREARIAPSGPGGVVIELHRKDVLATTIRPLPVQAADRVNLAGVPIGRHEDGSPWCFSLWQTHVLIAGATGAGKGSILWSLLHGLSPAINAGWVQVWAIDPKGGMELRPGARLFSRFEDGTPETMCDLLEDLVAVMDARAKRLAAQGIRKHQPSPDSPHVLAVIDELATLTAFAERSVVRRIEQALGLLLTKGRAVGITVLAAVQDPGKDVVGWRDLFPTRVAMRLDNPIQVDMVLGEGARDLGATADHISETTPGVAFVRVEGTRAIRRVRAAYLTDDDIAALASRVTASPALTAPPTGPGPRTAVRCSDSGACRPAHCTGGARAAARGRAAPVVVGCATTQAAEATQGPHHLDHQQRSAGRRGDGPGCGLMLAPDGAPVDVDLAYTLAANEGVCVRPLLRKVTDRATGDVRTVPIRCGSTRESVCPPCATKARRVRMQQCREGWHLTEDPPLPRAGFGRGSRWA